MEEDIYKQIEKIKNSKLTKEELLCYYNSKSVVLQYFFLRYVYKNQMRDDWVIDCIRNLSESYYDTTGMTYKVWQIASALLYVYFNEKSNRFLNADDFEKKQISNLIINLDYIFD